MRRINLSFYSFIFSVLTISSIVIALLYKIFPLFTSKALYLCQKLFSNIMLDVPRSFTNTFLLIMGVILGIGFFSLLLQLIKTRTFLRRLLVKRIKISSPLARILERLGLTNKVILVRNRNLFSFCYGIFSPSIVISTDLVKSLTSKELEAVLLHEQSHLMSRDPVKVLLGKTFSSMFFFLPLLRELYKNTEAVNEMLADQWTIGHQESSVFLRSALKKILAKPQLSIAAVSHASGPDYFEIRIHRLINPGIKHQFRLSLGSLVTTFLFILISWFFLQAPVSAFHMGPMDNSTSLLCSMEQSCSEQCHSDTDQRSFSTNKQINYSSSQLRFSEKQCD